MVNPFDKLILRGAQDDPECHRRVRVDAEQSRSINRQSYASRLGSAKGFTLVEMLVSILITSLIVVAIYSIFRVQTHSVKIQESRLEAQEYARSVLDIMVREIRNAAYNPLVATLGTNCLGAPLPGAPAVLTAESGRFRFTYDFQDDTPSVLPNDPDGHCNGPDEDIEYRFDSTGCPAGFGNIYRKTLVPARDESLTDCNVPTNGLTLAYFKQDGNPAVLLSEIQRVQITVKVQSKNPDAQFGGQLTAEMTSNADLRNRGL